MKSCQCHRLPAQLGYFELQKFLLAPTFRKKLIGYYNDSAWEPQKSFATVWQASLPQFSALKFCNTEQTFTLASLIVSYHVGPWSPGGTQLKMGYSYVPPLRPLFHALFPKTTISDFFSSWRSYIRLKSQISEKFAFQSLKIEEKLSSYA